MEPTMPTSGKRPWLRQSWLLGAALLGACQTATGPAPPAQRFGGAVAADEPRAVLIARDILEQGGSAADAATALGFALTATLPSRAGLGGGGVCLARDGIAPEPDLGIPLGYTILNPKPLPAKPDAFVFVPQPLAGRPDVAQPALARGLAVLHARFGRLRWEQVVAPAENLARFGAPVSRALARDIAASGVQIPGPDGRPLREGVPILLPELSQALAAIRAKGAVDLQSGSLAQTFADGLRVDAAALRADALAATDALAVRIGNDNAYFAPSDGGAYAAALFREATADRRGRSRDDGARASAVRDAAAKLAARFSAPQGEAPTTGFTVVDARGAAVSCALTMGGLFGTQMIVPGTGVIAGAPVATGSAAARGLTTMVVVNDNTGQFIAGLAAGTDAAAPTSLVEVALATLAAERPLQQFHRENRAGSGRNLGEEKERPPSEIGLTQGAGLVNAIVCRDGLPREPRSCSAQHDPRGAGLSLAAEARR
jgi:gamma-glutamyltranspeptidase/glutathione hydrolase